MRIYLAGPIAGCSWAKASRWRKIAKKFLEKYGLLIFDPLAQVPRRDYVIRERDYTSQEMKKFLQQDYEALKLSDIVFFNLSYMSRPSIGSLIEWGWAEGKKRVLIPAPWAKIPVMFADAVTDSLEDALWWIIEQSNGEKNPS